MVVGCHIHSPAPDQMSSELWQLLLVPRSVAAVVELHQFLTWGFMESATAFSTSVKAVAFGTGSSPIIVARHRALPSPPEVVARMSRLYTRGVCLVFLSGGLHTMVTMFPTHRMEMGNTGHQEKHGASLASFPDHGEESDCSNFDTVQPKSC